MLRRYIFQCIKSAKDLYPKASVEWVNIMNRKITEEIGMDNRYATSLVNGKMQIKTEIYQNQNKITTSHPLE